MISDLPTICSICGSTEYTDSPCAFSLRVNRYCNNTKPHSMGIYFREPEDAVVATCELANTNQEQPIKEPGSEEDIHAGLVPEKKDQAMSSVQDTTTSTNNTVRLPIKDIDRSCTQVRAGLNQKTVSDYAKAMSELKKRKADGEIIDSSDEFPPPVVFFDGKYFILADGFHRVAAALEVGETEIECERKTGSFADALKYAFAANANRRGLYMSNADKRASVKKAIESGLANGMSDRDLAKLCFVSNWLVSDVKRELKEGLLDSNSQDAGDDEEEVEADQESELLDSNSPNSGFPATSGSPLKPRKPKPANDDEHENVNQAELGELATDFHTDQFKKQQVELAKKVESGTEIGVPIPVIRQALSVYGALIRELSKLHSHPQSKIKAYDLGCKDALNAIQTAIMSVNGPVEIVAGRWVTKGDDSDGLIADTIAAIEHTKLLVLKKVTAA